MYENTIINCVYFEGHKGWTMIKRFVPEIKTSDEAISFISDHKDSKLYLATTSSNPTVNYTYKKDKELHEFELELAGYMDVKGMKAIGNKLGEFKILKIKELATEEKSNLNPGDTLELDF